MLDEKDLQVVTKQIGESEARTAEKISQSEAPMSEKIDSFISESESRLMAMMKSRFDPKFNLLEEQLNLIIEKLTPVEVQEETEARLDVLETVVKRHSREIEQLKKAQ